MRRPFRGCLSVPIVSAPRFRGHLRRAGTGRVVVGWMVALGAVLAPGPVTAQYVRDVPYFHQLFNSINPTGSCQNTSIAIVLDTYGAEVHPDDLSQIYGTEKAKTVSGWEQIFNEQARRFGLAVRDSSRDTARLSDVLRRLDRGLPVPVHGPFTSSGHLIVLLGYDDRYYYVHDPNGDWSRNYQLDTPTAGRYARYPREPVERTIVNPLSGTVRMHALYFEPGPLQASWLAAPADTVVGGAAARFTGRLRVHAGPGLAGPLQVVAHLADVGGPAALALSAVDDTTWTLDAAVHVPPVHGRRAIDVEIAAGDRRTHLRAPVVIAAGQALAIVDDDLAAAWEPVFVHSVEVSAETDTAFAGQAALAFDAGSFIYQLQPRTSLDLDGYATLRLAFHPGTSQGGRRPAFSVLANEDPRALVKLIDGDLPGVGVDLSRPEWQVVDIPLSAFSWLEAPLTSLRFFGSLRGRFYLDEVQFLPARPFPDRVAWAGAVPDSVLLGSHRRLEVAVRLRPGQTGVAPSGRAPRVTADLSDLGGPAELTLAAGPGGLYRSAVDVDIERPGNGRAALVVTVEDHDGLRLRRAHVRRPVVVLPRCDRVLYDDDLAADWRLGLAANVDLEPVQAEVVHSGQAAMRWQTRTLIVEYRTDTPVEPVGYRALRLAVYPEDAEPGPVGAFSVMVNGDSRQVVPLLGRPGGLDLNRRQWQTIDIPLSAFGLEEPVRTVRLFGDLTGTLYVDDVRFVAAAVSEPVTAVTGPVEATPADFALGQPYPNPFNSTILIPFRVAAAGPAELTVHNLLGQRLRRLRTGVLPVGAHQVLWDGADDAGRPLASGTYVVRLRAGGRSGVAKVLLLR